MLSSSGVSSPHPGHTHATPTSWSHPTLSKENQLQVCVWGGGWGGGECKVHEDEGSDFKHAPDLTDLNPSQSQKGEGGSFIHERA